MINETKRNGITRRAFVKLAGGIGLAAAGAAFGAYKLDLGPFKPGPVPATFDNSKNSGMIGVNNTVLISEDALAKIPTVAPSIKHDISLLMPIQTFSADVSYSKIFSGDEGPFYGEAQTEYAKSQNIKDTFFLIDVPENTVLLSPVDGSLIYYLSSDSPPGTVSSMNFNYTSPEKIIYQILLSTIDAKSFKPLVNATPFSSFSGGYVDQSPYRVAVKRGQPVIQTTSKTNIELFSQAWPSGIIGQSHGDLYPMNITFITVPDNLGNNKIATLAK